VQQNLDFVSQQAYHADFNLKQSLFRIGDDCVYDRYSLTCWMLLSQIISISIKFNLINIITDVPSAEQ